MVVLSQEAYEDLVFSCEIYTKLEEAEREAEMTSKRYSPKDVLRVIRERSAKVASHAD